MDDQPQRPDQFRRRVDKQCVVCGRLMEGVLVSRRTCGNTCRSRLGYWERKARTEPYAAYRLALILRGTFPTAQKDD